MMKLTLSKIVEMYRYYLKGLILVLLLNSCTQQPIQLPQLSIDERVSTEEYLIGPEDTVEVMVWKNPDLSRTVIVRPDGKISLPLIGDVQAAGLTAIQLKDSITERLKLYYKETPQISIILQQINSYSIYILGEVRNPGKYVVKTGTSFLQAITLAGGFTEFASKNRIMIRRKLENNEETYMKIKYNDLLAGIQNNIMLKSGDTIVVP
jgi:polysaccharide export outer membrane protein